MFGTTFVKLITEGSVVVTKNGEDSKLEPVNQVIVAIGVTPRNTLKDMLQKKGIRHFIVGDAVAPAVLLKRRREGAKAAWDAYDFLYAFKRSLCWLRCRLLKSAAADLRRLRLAALVSS